MRWTGESPFTSRRLMPIWLAFSGRGRGLEIDGDHGDHGVLRLSLPCERPGFSGGRLPADTGVVRKILLILETII